MRVLLAEFAFGTEILDLISRIGIQIGCLKLRGVMLIQPALLPKSEDHHAVARLQVVQLCMLHGAHALSFLLSVECICGVLHGKCLSQ